MNDLIDRWVAIEVVAKALKGTFVEYEDIAEKIINKVPTAQSEVLACGEGVLNAQPETARRIVGKSRNGMTLWYQCEMCNEPVDAQDNFCRGCGRRLTDE